MRQTGATRDEPAVVQPEEWVGLRPAATRDARLAQSAKPGELVARMPDSRSRDLPGGMQTGDKPEVGNIPVLPVGYLSRRAEWCRGHARHLRLRMAAWCCCPSRFWAEQLFAVVCEKNGANWSQTHKAGIVNTRHRRYLLYLVFADVLVDAD